jgi:hypothetical protein
MPDVSTSGATWTLWWPEIDSHPYLTPFGNGGTPYTTGPLYAENLSTGQKFYRDSAGVWHGPFTSLSASVSPPLGQRVAYAVNDWLQFVYPDGTSSGWIPNGLRVAGYSGPNATDGIVLQYDSYGLPLSVAEFGCLY